MDFIRNKDVQKQITVCCVLTVFWIAVDVIVNGKFNPIITAAVISVCLVSLIYTYQRYRKISLLSLEIDKLLHGDYEISFSEFTEGELAVLSSEISKMTQRLTEQAEALKSEKTNLADALADISHQLKTPLTSLNILNASLLKDELSDDERYELCRKQLMLLSRMEWLILTLLKISKLDSGMIVLKSEQTILKEIVDKAVSPLLVSAELKEQTIKISIPENCKINADSEWTAEAIGNIVKNCIEHSPMVGIVEICATQRPLLTQITVTDNGPGIEPKDIPNLFDRFYQGDNHSMGNAGLGLALAKTIIVNQGGSLTAENNTDGGAKFSINFYNGTV